VPVFAEVIGIFEDVYDNWFYYGGISLIPLIPYIILSTIMGAGEVEEVPLWQLWVFLGIPFFFWAMISIFLLLPLFLIYLLFELLIYFSPLYLYIISAFVIPVVAVGTMNIWVPYFPEGENYFLIGILLLVINSGPFIYLSIKIWNLAKSIDTNDILGLDSPDDFPEFLNSAGRLAGSIGLIVGSIASFGLLSRYIDSRPPDSYLYTGNMSDFGDDD
jgi:hypothetical protein